MAYKIKSPLHRTFVENVKARRTDLGLTQIEAAEKLGVSQPTYAQIELGRAVPSLEMVERVAKALSMNPLQLLIPLELVGSGK